MFWIIRDTLSAGQGFGKYKVCGAAAYQILQYQQYQSGTQFNGAVMLHNLLVAFIKGCMCYQGGASYGLVAGKQAVANFVKFADNASLAGGNASSQLHFTSSASNSRMTFISDNSVQAKKPSLVTGKVLILRPVAS